MPEMPFTLSSGEKLILLMLRDLYKQLGVKGEIDPDFVASAIYGGHLLALKEEYRGVPFDDTPEELAKEVSDIMSMWDYVETSYEQLPPEDQQTVKDGVEYWSIHSQFRGFDGNDETKHYSVARFLVKDMGGFERFKSRELNSHTGVLPRYRAMLPIHDKYLHDSVNGGRWGFTAQELIEIMNANA